MEGFIHPIVENHKGQSLNLVVQIVVLRHFNEIYDVKR